jgi:hypothetical protein
VWDRDLGELAEDQVLPTPLLRQLSLQRGEPIHALMGGLIHAFEAVELLECG